jgi:hypothetical protein
MRDIAVRNYTPSDLAAIQKIHEANGIDYRLPDLSKFPVNKVLEVEGEVRAAYGLQYAYEAHLWLDESKWTDAAGKWLAIQALDREATQGVSGVLCCVPPGYERFGKRIKDLGFTPLRDGWKIYCKAGDGK